MRALVAMLGALALAGAAGAKGPTTASVCGPSGCRPGEAALLDPVDGRPYALAAAPRPAPYHVVFLSAPGEHGFCRRVLWVPTRRVLRIESLRRYVVGDPVAGRHWRTVDAVLARRLDRGVRGVPPFGPSAAWRSPKPRCAGNP